MDPEQLAKLLRRDSVTWREFLKEYDRFVKPIVFRIVKNTQDFEDCYQDLMSDLPAKLKTYRPGKPFKPWFFKVVLNHAVRWRKRHCDPESIVTRTDDLKPQHPIDESQTPEHDLLSQELKGIINSVIEASENSRQIRAFVMYHLHQISYPEMANFFSISAENARNLVSRGKRRFGKLLLSMYPDYFQERKR